jgi:hypothetical protein
VSYTPEAGEVRTGGNPNASTRSFRDHAGGGELASIQASAGESRQTLMPVFTLLPAHGRGRHFRCSG